MIIDSASEKAAVAHSVLELISSVLPNVPVGNISGSRSLKDYGADSVDRVEIILSIMKRFGIHESMSTFSGIANIEELVGYVCRVRQQ